MKKILLSGTIIFLFLAYSFQQQRQASSVAVIPPSNLTQTPQPTNTPSDTPPSNSTPPNPEPTATPTTPPQSSGYKDGSYTGDVADAFYGNIQVQATINGGRITDVQFLQYPNDRATSIAINSQAMPYLKQEAIAAQSANVDIITGASDTSRAFQESLQAALDKAKS